jgi:hypothetical protein
MFPLEAIKIRGAKEVITRIRTRNAEGDTAKNRYRNIGEIESILKKVNSRVRSFF